MAKHTTTIAIDPQDVLGAIEEQKEFVLPRCFTLQFDDQLLTLCYKEKAIVLASVYLAFDENSEECLDVQISHVLNADLDVSTEDCNVATVSAAGAAVRTAFEAKIHQIISQY